MIVIKSVEVVHAEPGQYGIIHSESLPVDRPDNHKVPQRDEAEVEYVDAKMFSLPDGRKVEIGWSKQVHEALRIPLACVEDQSKIIEDQAREILRLRKRKFELQQELDEVRTWSWWRRLKFFVWKE